MKLQSLIVLLALITFLASCSNENYQHAIDQGMKELGQKNYHQAAIYFELALNEKEGDRDAASYFDQATNMERAKQAYKEKDYESAIKSLDVVINEQNGLKTVQDEAETLRKQIMEENNQTSSVEEKITFINELLKKNNMSEAEKELQHLQATISSNEILNVYESKVNELIKQIELATSEADENEQLSNSTNDEKEREKEREKEKKKESKQKSISYQHYTNERYGFSLKVPSNLKMAPPPTNGDGVRFYSEDFEVTAYGNHTNIISENETIETYYNEDLNSIPVNIAYKRLTANWYVLSYEQNGLITYKKFFFGNEVANTIIMTYPASEQSKYGSIVTHIIESFSSSAY
ncbi:hypothetical protein ACEWK1_00675 [Metabacillus sp. YM-086]|uniref:hypothetical protein n=1 Tax=Metabacillus sp. YM-086 TaxID=3341729 RepID=UPI003A83D9BA